MQTNASAIHHGLLEGFSGLLIGLSFWSLLLFSLSLSLSPPLSLSPLSLSLPVSAFPSPRAQRNVFRFWYDMFAGIFDLIIVVNSLSLLGDLTVTFIDLNMQFEVPALAVNLYDQFKNIVLFDFSLVTWIVPYFTTIIDWVLGLAVVDMKVPALAECKGLSALTSLSILLMLTGPFFFLVERDYLGKAATRWSHIDWHSEPRHWSVRSAGIYRNTITSAIWKQAYVHFVKLWLFFCKGLESTLDVTLQLMVITMCSKYVQLFKLIEFSTVIGFLSGGELKQRQCGLTGENPNWALNYLDGALLEVILIIFVPTGTLVLFFIVPLMFSSRTRDAWHVSNIMKALAGPRERVDNPWTRFMSHFMSLMRVHGGSRRNASRYAYHLLPSLRIPLFCCCGENVTEHSRHSDMLRLVYRSLLCGGRICSFVLPAEVSVAHCWPSTKWLSKGPLVCMFSGMVYMLGGNADHSSRTPGLTSGLYLLL